MALTATDIDDKVTLDIDTSLIVGTVLAGMIRWWILMTNANLKNVPWQSEYTGKTNWV